MWSWVLAIVGITGIFIVGKKSIVGWVILLVNENLWVIYAVKTHQYGFIAAAIGYATVYIKNFVSWSRPRLAR